MTSRRQASGILVLVTSVVLLATACAGPIASNPQEEGGEAVPSYGLISVEEARGLIAERLGNEDFVLLDIRTDGEIEAGHIAGTQALDYYAPSFRDELAQLDRERTYLIYCRTGNRTGQTLRIMEELGFEKVYDMDGGITEWRRRGDSICLGPLDAEHTCSEASSLSSDT